MQVSGGSAESVRLWVWEEKADFRVAPGLWVCVEEGLGAWVGACARPRALSSGRICLGTGGVCGYVTAGLCVWELCLLSKFPGPLPTPLEKKMGAS